MMKSDGGSFDNENNFIHPLINHYSCPEHGPTYYDCDDIDFDGYSKSKKSLVWFAFFLVKYFITCKEYHSYYIKH